MTANISKNVLKKIKEKHIKPKAKWLFQLKSIIIWSLVSLFLLINSLTFSVIIYIIKNNDWRIYKNINPNILRFIFLSLPYFWLISFSLVTFIIYYNFRKTKKGYKYNVFKIAGFIFLLSLILGFIFNFFAIGNFIEDNFDKHVPIYQKVLNKQVRLWHAPKKGVLVGKIDIIKDKNLFLIDSMQKKWEVSLVDLKIDVKRKQEIDKFFQNKVKHKPIKVIGEKTGEFKFKAYAIYPLIGKCNFPELRKSNCNNLKCPHLKDSNFPELKNERNFFEMRSK